MKRWIRPSAGARGLLPLLVLLTPNGALAGLFAGERLDLMCSDNAATCQITGRSCDETAKKIKELVDQDYETYIKHMYVDGVYIDFQTSSPGNIKGEKLGGKVCNLAKMKHPYDRNAYYHPGSVQHCGASMQATKDGAVAKNGRGARENSYMIGNIEHASECHKAKVYMELESKKLQISAPCAGIAEDLKKLSAKVDSHTTVILKDKSVQKLCHQYSRGSVGKTVDLKAICADESNKNFDSLKEVGAGQGGTRLHACQMARAEESALTAFAAFVSCEIWARTMHSHQNIFAKPDGDFDNKVTKYISSECSRQGNDAAHSGLFPSESRGVRKAQECMDKNTPVKWKDYLLSNYDIASGKCKLN